MVDADVIVVGGSYAGISAALPLARARRRVVVIDAGQRRNRAAHSSHGFLGRDGHDPARIAEEARAQLALYPTVTWMRDTAIEARAEGDGFRVIVGKGEALHAKRIVLACGVADELPDVPGVAELWGTAVFHCPYCHGYELGGARAGVLATSPASVHAAMLLPDWGPTTYFTRGTFEPTDDERAALERRGVAFERAPVVSVAGVAEGVEVRLGDGRSAIVRGLFLLPKTRIASPLAAQLGCALEEGPLGAFLRTDAMKETTVKGVFACGDAALAAGSVAFAVGDGARAGVSAHQSLIFRRA